jgi:hypothetical protein
LRLYMIPNNADNPALCHGLQFTHVALYDFQQR